MLAGTALSTVKGPQRQHEADAGSGNYHVRMRTEILGSSLAPASPAGKQEIMGALQSGQELDQDYPNMANGWDINSSTTGFGLWLPH